jgi:alpha-glucosidase
LLRTHTADLAETQIHVAGIRRVLDEYDDRVLIGEANLPVTRMIPYYGVSLSGFQLPFNFHLIKTPWNALAIARLVDQYEAALPAGAWPNWVLGNHDKSRVATRLGGMPQARLAAVLLLTLRGTPTIYNGEEIGMVDGAIAPSEVQDPWEKNAPGLGLGRDPCRTPMQWSAEPGAGFTQGRPWLPLAAGARKVNVAAETSDPRSTLWLYKRLLALRELEEALKVGAYRLLEVTDDTLLFERRLDDRCLCMALNFTDAPQRVSLNGQQQVLISTHADRAPETQAEVTTLAPFEGVVISMATTLRRRAPESE